MTVGGMGFIPERLLMMMMIHIYNNVCMYVCVMQLMLEVR